MKENAKKSFWSRYLYLMIIIASVLAIATTIITTALVSKKDKRTEMISKEVVWVMPVEKPTLGVGFHKGANVVYNETQESYRSHPGVDIKAEKDSKIFSCVDGKIITLNRIPTRGIVMAIEASSDYSPNGDKIVVTYEGLGEDVLNSFNVGDSISAGQQIGKITNTDTFRAYAGYHIYLSVKLNDNHVDPLSYLPEMSK